MSETFTTFFALSKVEEQSDGSLRVYARGTQEVRDRDNEIMDFASTAPFVKAWSDEVYKDTNGKSYGNIRIMHNPELGAAGVLASPPIFKADEKAIDLVMDIVDKNEINKVKRGVYSGVSMGGKYHGPRWPDPENPSLLRYTGEPSEWSLVDRPCVPTAVIQMVKLDGTMELIKMDIPGIDITLESGNSEGDGIQLPVELSTSSSRVEEVPVLAGVVIPHAQEIDGMKSAELAEKLLEVVGKFEAIKKADEAQLELLKSYGSRVGIVRREGEPLTPPSDYPSTPAKYADPANLSYPVDEARLITSVQRYNGGGDLQKYQPREWMILGRRIARMAGEVSGIPHNFDPSNKQIRKVHMSTIVNFKKGTDVGALLGQVAGNLKDAVEQIGTDPEKVKDLLIQAVAAIDVAADHSTVDTSTESPEVPVNATIATMKGAGMEAAPTFENIAPPTSMSTPSMSTGSTATGSTPSMSTPSGSTPANMTEPSDRTKTPTEPETETETYKVLKAILEKLSGPVPVAKADGIPAPVGDLASLLTGAPIKNDDFKKALLSGDLRKASEIAGGDHEVNALMGIAVDEEIKNIFGFTGKAPIYANQG